MPSVNGLPRQTSGRYKSQIIPVNNIIGLDKYYRSAHLLLRQVLYIHFLWTVEFGIVLWGRYPASKTGTEQCC